ncbi:ATP synthase Fo complex subunit b [Gammaproteobacteria bacterium]
MNVTATLLGQMITFTVLVLFVKEYLWGPVTQALEDRKKRIADGLAAAERGHHERELGKKKAMEIIREARASAAEMIEQANIRAHDIIEDAEGEARAAAERQMLAAQTEIEQAASRAREQLRHELVVLAVAAAERILRKEVDAKEHEQLLAHFAANL